jgi:2-(1,2-epoxy-1,2-dihydrophenyl)acetyl-CoA isomerase
MAGGDLAELRADPTGGAIALLGPAHEAVVLLAELHAPVIAAVHGAVAGAGMSLALACDVVLAAEGTRFTLAYVKIGTSCDVSASWSLPRLVGLRKALEIALLSEPFDAAEALRLGLVNRVVPAAELEVQAQALAQRLASGPWPAIANLKRLMRTSFDHDLRGQLDAERSSFLACAASADFAEGIDAFVSKRPARFGQA